MRDLLFRYFGEDESYGLYIIDFDGKEWVEANFLFLLMGVENERYLLGNSRTWPEMNLTQDDKCKVTLTGEERHANWYVSETGFWKIVAKSRTPWAARVRASFLPVQFA